jgi:hypothetical protein
MEQRSQPKCTGDKYPPVRFMSQEEKDKHVSDLKELLKTVKDVKKRNKIYARIDYVNKFEQRRIQKKKKYIEQNKDVILAKTNENLKLLSAMAQ